MQESERNTKSDDSCDHEAASASSASGSTSGEAPVEADAPRGALNESVSAGLEGEESAIGADAPEGASNIPPSQEPHGGGIAADSSTADASGSDDGHSAAANMDPLSDETSDEAGDESASDFDGINPAPDDFDPDEPGAFDDLVTNFGEPPELTARFLKALSEPEEFKGFECEPGTEPTPAFHLSISAAQIQRIVRMQKMCSRPGRKPRAFRFSITAGKATAQVHEDAFCELCLDLTFLHLEPGAKAVIYLRGDDLQITEPALEEDVELRYCPALPLIHLKSGNFERPLVLEDPSAFTHLNERSIGPVIPGPEQAIPDVFASGIRYVAPHVGQNDIQEFLSCIDCQNGQILGGRMDILARVRTPQLEGLDLCFSHEDAKLLADTIEGASDRQLLGTQHFHVIRTGELSVGIPRFKRRSALSRLPVEVERDRHVILPRTHLSNALLRVEHAIGEDSVVRLSSKSVGNTRLILRATGPDGTALRDPLQAYSYYYEAFDISVRCSDLQAAVGKQTSTNVLLRLLQGTLVIDDTDGDLEAITLIVSALSARNIQPDTSDGAHALLEHIET